MTAPKQMHVAANFPQDFTNEEKAQARDNIGAAPLYTAGYGISINGQTISKTHHKLMATNNIQYTYCKVFDFTWQYVYGRGQCTFTATHYGGDYVTFTVSATRALGANYTVAWPYVVSASPDMVNSYAFVERLEIREIGSRIVGYLKLRNFSQNQFWLDWEGSSNAGILSFTPELTNSPEGDIAWTCTVDSHDVPYTQYDVSTNYQKLLTEGNHIHITSDGVISADGIYTAEYGVTSFEQIRDAIASGEHVVMTLNGGVGEASYASYGGFNSYPDYDEYYFFSLGKGGQRTIYRINTDTGWGTYQPNELEGRVLIATYGSTTYHEITQALLNGQYVAARYGSSYFWLNHVFDDRVVFTSKAQLSCDDAMFATVDSDDQWTTTYSTPPVTTFAQHGSTTPSDDWNWIDSTSSFMLAQKGTHGGTMQLGMKLTPNGWSGSYKLFTILYHNSSQTSAPVSGTTSFSTVTLGGESYVEIGLVPQYMLQSGTQWTYIIEVTYSGSTGRSIRITVSGIGSSDITFLGEEIR